jgi:hypothetical protein
MKKEFETKVYFHNLDNESEGYTTVKWSCVIDALKDRLLVTDVTIEPQVLAVEENSREGFHYEAKEFKFNLDHITLGRFFVIPCKVEVFKGKAELIFQY